MKKLFAIAFILLFLPVTAHAHSGLSVSTPAEGESLSESPKEIRFEFDTPIRQGEMTLVDESGSKVELSNITASETELIGELDAVLPNGAYTVDWNVISEDSHEVTGTLIFNVAAEETVATEEAVEEEAATEEAAEATAPPAEEESAQTVAAADNPAEESTSWVTIILIAILAAAAVAFFVMARRRK